MKKEEDEMTNEEDNKIIKAIGEVAKEKGWSVLTGEDAWKFVQEEMNKPENVRAREHNTKQQEKRFKEFDKQEHKYKWEKGMGEISGMGGDYEQACRTMLIAGLEYWDAHPELDPKYRGFKDVYGIMSDDNEDAKKLDDAVLEPVNRDCTGAMHQAVIQSILYIKKNGWEKY